LELCGHGARCQIKKIIEGYVNQYQTLKSLLTRRVHTRTEAEVGSCPEDPGKTGCNSKTWQVLLQSPTRKERRLWPGDQLEHLEFGSNTKPEEKLTSLEELHLVSYMKTSRSLSMTCTARPATPYICEGWLTVEIKHTIKSTNSIYFLSLKPCPCFRSRATLQPYDFARFGTTELGGSTSA
jgi:hypothetical protein